MLCRHFVVGVFVVVALSACGGGGGGGGGGSDSPAPTPSTPSTPPPAALDITNQAVITRANASLIASSLSDLTATVDAVRYNTPYMFAGPQSILLVASNQHSAGKTLIDFTEPCLTGSTRYQGSFDDASGTGTLTITSQDCEYYANFRYNGSSRLNVRGVDSNKLPNAFDFTYEDTYQTYDDDNAVYYNGSIVVDPVANGAQAVANFTVQFKPDDDYMQAKNLISTYRAGAYQAIATSERSGRIGYSKTGYVDVTGTPNTSSDPGQLLLSGADQSKLRVSLPNYAYGSYSRFALDADGDGNYDAFLRALFYSLNIVSTTNTAPQFNANTSFTVSKDTDLQLDISTAYDAEYDFLDYTVTPVSSPANVPMNLSITEDQFLNAHISGPGDYVFRLTINDRKGGVKVVTYNIHVALPAPVVTTSYQPVVADGSTVAINFAPSNSQFGPFTYTLNNAPEDMTIGSDGVLHWLTATTPYFHNSHVDATLTIANVDASITVPIKLTVTPANNSATTMPLGHSRLAGPTQPKGMVLGNFDADAQQELLVTDNNHLLYTLKWNGSTYLQNWVYPYSPAQGRAIRAIANLGDIDGDGSDEVAVLSAEVVDVISPRTNTLLGSTTIANALSGYAITAADLDGDGTKEIIALIGNDLYYSTVRRVVVLSATSLSELWSTAPLDLGSSLAVGNFDNDSAIEIATSGGYVFDAQSHANQWLNGSAFGDEIVAGDIIGDGRARIVAATSETLRAFDAATKTRMWETTSTLYSQRSITVTQLDGDAALEIVSTASSQGQVTAYDASAFGVTTKWTSNNNNYGATSIVAGDGDGDGRTEIYWVTGLYSRNLIAYDSDTQTVDYYATNPNEFTGPFSGGIPIRRPGQTDALIFGVGKTAESNNGSRLIMLDETTGNVTASPLLANSYDNSFSYCVSDYDGDGTDEVLFASNDYSVGFLAAYDFYAQITEWRQNNTHSSSAAPAIACMDMNGDGHSDMILSTATSVRIYDPFNQTLIWSSGTYSNGPLRVIPADMDSDGQPDLLVMTNSDLQLLKNNGTSFTLSASYTFGTSYYSWDDSVMLVSDVNQDGQLDIVLSVPTWNGSTLITLNKNFGLTYSVPLTSTISALSASSIPNRIIAASTTMLSYLYLNPPQVSHIGMIDVTNGTSSWRSPLLNGKVQRDSLRVLPAGNGLPERLVYATDNGIFITR